MRVYPLTKRHSVKIASILTCIDATVLDVFYDKKFRKIVLDLSRLDYKLPDCNLPLNSHPWLCPVLQQYAEIPKQKPQNPLVATWANI